MFGTHNPVRLGSSSFTVVGTRLVMGVSSSFQHQQTLDGYTYQRKHHFECLRRMSNAKQLLFNQPGASVSLNTAKTCDGGVALHQALVGRVIL